MMNSKTLLAGAAIAAALFAAGASQAQSYDVTIWNGAPDGVSSTTYAGATAPTGAAFAHYTYLGPIDWVNDTPNNGKDSTQNLFSQFLNSADITGYTGAVGEDTFLGTSMSDEGDDYASYFHIVGSYSGSNVTGTITHDDGASVFDYTGANACTPACTAGETSQITESFALPSGSHSFSVDYVEGNGSPSVLELDVSSVPEPATWAVMLAGFGGLGVAMRSRRKQAAATA